MAASAAVSASMRLSSYKRINSDELFWSNLMDNSGNDILLILITNTLFLTLLCCGFGIPSISSLIVDAHKNYQSIYHAKERFVHHAISLYILSWIILNTLAIISVLVIKYDLKKKSSKSSYNHANLWRNTGYTILLTRLLFLMIAIVSNFFGDTVCYSIRKQYDDGTFYVPLILMLVDVRMIYAV
jgi:hypothetical protein